MKLYKIERTDSIDYDEYDALVVRAKDEQQVRDIALGLGEFEKDGHYLGFGIVDNFTITEVTADGEPGVIVSSFNAG